MKRILALTLALILSVSLAACGGTQTPSAPAAPSTTAPAPANPAPAPAAPEPAPTTETFELALITDVGTIDDKSFNQGSWEGLKKYADENSIKCKYYQPAEKSGDSYLETIDLAVKGGAKLIVTPGFLFEVPIWEAQKRYPDVSFILVDGSPHDEGYTDFTIDPNVVGVFYAEEQAGFLAGYAAVKEGHQKLGFMGGMAVPAVIRFGYGYIQGADYAAAELGLSGLVMNYHYTGDFIATPEIQTMASAWYSSGISAIFGCGGAVGNSVMAAAEPANAAVIGVDIDQSGESPSVITSAMKGLQVSVYDCVKAFYDGSFPGGTNLIFGADNDGVGLPMSTSKFATFTQADYDAIFAKLANNEIAIQKDTDAEKPTDITTKNITVTYFE